MNQPLPTRTPVTFDIAQGLVLGTGVIAEADHDDGWLYRIEVEDISHGDVASHLNGDGQLWVCDFEVRMTDGGAA